MIKVIKRIIKILLIIAIIAWVAIVITDYLGVINNKQAKFCIKRETINTETKKTERCTGLGYFAERYYKNGELSGYEFRPFFMKSKNAEN